MNVVAENDSASVPRVHGHPFVARWTHDERRRHFPLFPSGSARRIKQSRAARNCQPAEDICREFGRLFVAEVVDLRQLEPVAEADYAKANRDEKGGSFRQRRMCWPPVTRCRVFHIVTPEESSRCYVRRNWTRGNVRNWRRLRRERAF